MSFNKLGLSPLLVRTCQKLQYQTPTAIQALSIPKILSGQSIIANSQTGSGKTAAFGLPLIQKLSKQPFSIFALIIAPSRQLAIQINQQISIFGQGINLRLALLIGGVQYSKQIQQLERYPHIIIGTPGRIVDMLDKCDRFKEDIQRVDMLVLDEADRLFEQSMIDEMKKIVKSSPNLSQIILATATIDENFEGKKLQNLLQTQIKFTKYSTYNGIKTVSSASLTQEYIFTPEQLKPGYLMSLLNQNTVYKIIIFIKTCKECTLMAQTLKFLKYRAVALHSFMKLNQRIANLGMFRTEQANILVTTDLTSRGIDIPNVNLVINYNMPRKVSDYVHRVGRTARNGFDGEAISLVTQYEQQLFLGIQRQIGVKITQHKMSQQLDLVSQYNKARRQVKIQLLSSGVISEIDKKSQAKRTKKFQIKNLKQKKIQQ